MHQKSWDSKLQLSKVTNFHLGPFLSFSPNDSKDLNFFINFYFPSTFKMSIYSWKYVYMASNTVKVILSILILGLRFYQIFFTTCRLWTKKKRHTFKCWFLSKWLGESCKAYICLAEGDYAFRDHFLKSSC